jgi:hypothetical protein
MSKDNVVPLVSASDLKKREDDNIGPNGLKIERYFTQKG